jgi:N-acyl-D-aspartate/D-glutamate deacylase
MRPVKIPPLQGWKNCAIAAAAMFAIAGIVVAPPFRAAASAHTFPASRQTETYDLVIAGGRVMDPESGLDAIGSVGISGGKIRAISESPLAGKSTIDAKDLVVAPGFIDLHEHGQQPRNYQFQAHDGVTTSLELEVGTDDVDSWYAQREGQSLINYGVSIGHIPVRRRVLTNLALDQMLTAKPSAADMATIAAAEHRQATPEELAAMEKMMEQGFRRGALAEGMGINYTPGASRWEILELFRQAAKYHASVHVHLRYAGVLEPESGLNALEEVLAAAAESGAPLHVVHVTSMGLADTPHLMQVITDAQRHGLDVTMECYPYTAGSTLLDSAVFDPGWQQRMAITYHDLQWAATGERLTEETFAKYRKQGGIVVIHSIPEDAARAAVANPLVMIASDGMPITGPKIHPRGQGTFSRVLGYYVREQNAIDLMTALRKMTLLPAQRLEKRAPAFHDKGRIRVGADADITVFDPQRIIDKATFDDPLQYSDGIAYVFVNGVPVLQNGKLIDNVFPGKAARAPISP